MAILNFISLFLLYAPPALSFNSTEFGDTYFQGTALG